MAPRAPWSRERTVPTGMPSTSAISSCVSVHVVLQDEDGALLGGQPLEPPLQLVPIVDRQVGVGVGGAIGQAARRCLPAAPAVLGVRSVDKEPVGPRFEPIRIAEAGQLAPDGDQRLLCRVLGTRPVPQDAVRDRVEPIHDAEGKLVEGVMIAFLRADHQLTLHVPASMRSLIGTVCPV